MLNNNDIGKRIAGMRKNINYTQQQLADELQISFQAISKWESGQNIPTVELLYKLSKIFDTSIDYMLTGKVDDKHWITLKDQHAGENNNNYMRRKLQEAIGKHDPRLLYSATPFANIYEPDFDHMKEPVLVFMCNSAGSKKQMGLQFGYEKEVCFEMVNRLVNDVVVRGAKPVMLRNMMACDNLQKSLMIRMTDAIAQACAQSEVTLAGNEAAFQSPIVSGLNSANLCAAIVGVVDKERVIDGSKVSEGDVILAIETRGLHGSNFAYLNLLIQKFSDTSGYDMCNHTFIKEILQPQNAYYQCLKKLFTDTNSLHGLIQIGSSVLRNRYYDCIPDGLCARINLADFRCNQALQVIHSTGTVREEDMPLSFNFGIGMLVITDKKHKTKVKNHIKKMYDCYEIGEIIKTDSLERNELGEIKKVSYINSINW